MIELTPAERTIPQLLRSSAERFGARPSLTVGDRTIDHAELVDVAATYAGALGVARKQGLDVGALRILAKTGRIPYDALVAGPHVSDRLAQRLTREVGRLNTQTEEGRRTLPTSGVSVNGCLPA